MWNFQDTFETRKPSFVSTFLIWVTVPLILFFYKMIYTKSSKTKTHITVLRRVTGKLPPVKFPPRRLPSNKFPIVLGLRFGLGLRSRAILGNLQFSYALRRHIFSSVEGKLKC